MKKITYYAVAAIVIALLLFAAYYIFRYIIPTRLESDEFRTSIVDSGLVINTVDAEGIVEPENEVLLRSHANGVIKRIVNVPGSHVKPGEVILLMDTDPIQKEIENAEDQLEVMKNNLHKNRLNARSNRVDLDYNVEMKKLKIASIKSELADQKQLLEVGGISPARIDKTEQELVLAEKDLETTLQKNSIRLKQLEAEEEGMLLQIQIMEKGLEDKQETLSKMVITAPSAGIILNIYGREGEKFGAGDLLVQMSNMTSFKITGSLDEKFAEYVKTGGKVYVQIDEDLLPGQIGRVRPVIENNRVNFDIYIEQSSHPKLIPNLKLPLKVVTAQRDSVLRIQKGPAFGNTDRQQVFITEQDMAVRTEVVFGLQGTDYIEIVSGLKEGDEVITSDISPFRHMKEIEIIKN
ncbi:MAG: HlyD family efflux transporter periplasmic adaptor subunit [Bacteroidales bacterium]|nr:HlyD family efflux transporter periplasmic adaptor subunit [Bacteroidales bacterium]